MIEEIGFHRIRARLHDRFETSEDQVARHLAAEPGQIAKMHEMA
jgi:hypothetical protein